MLCVCTTYAHCRLLSAPLIGVRGFSGPFSPRPSAFLLLSVSHCLSVSLSVREKGSKRWDGMGWDGMDGRTDGPTEGSKEAKKQASKQAMDGWTDGWTDGRRDRWKTLRGATTPRRGPSSSSSSSSTTITGPPPAVHQPPTNQPLQQQHLLLLLQQLRLRLPLTSLTHSLNG